MRRDRDKDMLTEYDLDVNIFNNFDLNVIDLIPNRSVYTLVTDKGTKILKKIDYSLEELMYINEALDYIKKSFKRVPSFLKGKDNNIYTLYNGDIYCVMDLIEGRECEFNNPFHIKIAARGLGELHKASEGIRVEGHKNNCGEMIKTFERRKEEMQFFKNIAWMCEIKNEFDKVFLENFSFLIHSINKSIEILKGSYYYKLCSEEDKITLCHHDLAYHNILIKDDLAHFIDFDYCIIDLKVHDLCNLINKVVKDFSFEIDKALIIIDEYKTANSLEGRELQVLYGMLNFPQDIYCICRDYYTRRKDWSFETFLYRLKKKIGFKEDREEFLEEFKNKFLTNP